MEGRHRGSTVYGPRFTRQPIRHANRNQAGDRSTELGSTLLLIPEDGPGVLPPLGRYTGRHRVRGGHRPA
jgi:hypothetical protein